MPRCGDLGGADMRFELVREAALLREELPGITWYCLDGRSKRESRLEEANESLDPCRVCVNGMLGGRERVS